MMRTIIAGSRHLPRDDFDRDAIKVLIKSVLRPMTADPFGFGNITILSGMARGIDTFAITVAKEEGWNVEEYPAKWDEHGKAAGFIRNEEMARNADMLIAFWDGESRGTKHMINTALTLGLDVHVFQFPTAKETT